jgi:hypothetical protein
MILLKKIPVIISIAFLPCNALADANLLEEAKNKLFSCYSEEMIESAARVNNVTEDFAREIFTKTPRAFDGIRDSALLTERLHLEGKESEIKDNIQEIENEMPGASDGLLRCYEFYKVMLSGEDLNEFSGNYDGPFGLIFGQGSEDVKYDYLHNVDLNSTNSGGFSCPSSVFSTSSPKINFLDLYETSSLEFKVQSDIPSNKLGADFSDRLSAKMYNIPIQNGLSEVCLAFFDDRLFLIHIEDNEYRRYRDVMKASLEKKYGPSNTYSNIENDLFITTWNSVDEILSIELITSMAGGALRYVYNPIKREQIPYLFDTYITHYNKVSAITDF